MTVIYFATNRNPNNDENPTDFGPDFAKSNLGNLRFGQVNVTEGKLDQNTIQVLPDNPEDGSLALLTQLRKTMREQSLDSLLFIHGFNTTFKEAIESAARMSKRYSELSGFKYQPNIFVFSWPSNGKLRHYNNDRIDAEASGYAFARGLEKLANFLRDSGSNREQFCQQRINLIAHSMGNYVLRYALQQSQKISGNFLPRLFNDIILTAADEDSDAFEHDHKLARLPELAQRITIYFNTEDKALIASDHTKGNPERLGNSGPSKPHQVPAKVVIVEVSDVVQDNLFQPEHSYHIDNENVAKDIIAVLQGQRSEKIIARNYIAHKNKFTLT